MSTKNGAPPRNVGQNQRLGDLNVHFAPKQITAERVNGIKFDLYGEGKLSVEGILERTVVDTGSHADTEFGRRDFMCSFLGVGYLLGQQPSFLHSLLIRVVNDSTVMESSTPRLHDLAAMVKKQLEVPGGGVVSLDWLRLAGSVLSETALIC